MSPPDSFETDVGERRKANRQAAQGKVRVTVETSELHGNADNIARSGILFFTDGALRVKVEFEQDGVAREMHGQLVRCERILGERRGWAVEFDQ